MDEQRTSILDEENGTPGDLGACRCEAVSGWRNGALEVMGAEPRSLTVMVLFWRRPVSWTRTLGELGITEPSLPLAMRRRWTVVPAAAAMRL